MTPIRVLVVEDEPVAAEVHAEYTQRVAGFAVVGVVSSAGDAYRFLSSHHEVDLVLLDLNLPDGHGLGLLRRLHAQRSLFDVVAVTSARDPDVVREAVALGVGIYLLKPFSFATFRAKLEAYADYRARVAASPREVVQHEVDQLLGSLHPLNPDNPNPKGISEETLALVVEVLRGLEGRASASRVAEVAGVSRVTARRYLEHLRDQGQVHRTPRYLASGPPVMEYTWSRPDGSST